MGTEILKPINRDAEEKQIETDKDGGENYIGSGMDCAVIPLKRHKQFSLVQTVDFFYPLVDDPRTMGKIALANVVSDIYAVGVTSIDKLSMLITAPLDFSEQQRDVVLPLIIEGFRESAKLAGCRVGVRSISVNPWCIIGGIASSINKQEEIIMPSNAKDGDLIVLTKPLGTHLATSAFIWMQEQNEKYQKLTKQFSNDNIKETFRMAISSMSYLNRNAALLMHKHGARGATDITGFGLLGHAQNLAEFQKDRVMFVINRLPIMKNVLQYAEILAQAEKLKAGTAVETSGGLLICLPAQNATAFCLDFEAVTNGEQRAWIVGHVEAADKRHAVLANVPEFLEVEI